MATIFARAPRRDEERRGVLGTLLRGAGGFVGNLVGDVKDAAAGFFPGIRAVVTDPPGAVATMVRNEWSIYSPLFRGNLRQFGHNVYDHPLAPLLDVATVFTLGVGGVARLGQAVGAQRGPLGAAARLREPATIPVRRPRRPGQPETDIEFTKQLSTRPGRRLIQEAIEPHLPNWWREARYQKYKRIDMAHRVAAKNLMLTTLLKAGQALTDPLTAPRARQELLAGAYLNLHRHARTITKEEWDALPIETKRHWRFIKDASLIDTRRDRELLQLRKREARWDRLREENAELAHALPSIRDELERSNQLLREMRERGYIVAGGARTRRKEPTARQRIEYEAAPLVEVQQNITRLERQLDKARQAKSIHRRATSELSRLKSERMDLEKRSYVDFFRTAGQSPESFESFVRNFGAHVTTKKINKAARTQDGRYRIVPRHDAHNLGVEMRESSRLVQLLWRKPTTIWKMLLLGYTPRVITNNAVGNWIIHAVREENPVMAVRTFYDAVAFAKGRKFADTSLKRAVPFQRDHWIYRYFGNELGNVFRATLEEQGLRRGVRQGLYPVVHKVADEPVRVAAIYAAMRRAPEVRALQAQGLDFERAATRALRRSPDLRQRVAEYARTVAGDYFTISREGRVLRDLFPFYLWDRHILKSTGNLLADNPGRVAFLQKVGMLGVEENEDWLGDLPEFLHSVVPLQRTGDGRADVLLTASLNPFATIGEIASVGEALTTGGGPRPGAAILSQVNPIISGSAQFITGQDPLTGARVDTRGGLVTDVAIQTGESLPFVRLIEEAMKGTRTVSERGNPLLFRHGPAEQLTSLFGVPIRSVNLMRAAEMARREAGIREAARSRIRPIFARSPIT